MMACLVAQKGSLLPVASFLEIFLSLSSEAKVKASLLQGNFSVTKQTVDLVTHHTLTRHVLHT
jgi:hypothetical protein